MSGPSLTDKDELLWLFQKEVCVPGTKQRPYEYNFVHNSVTKKELPKEGQL